MVANSVVDDSMDSKNKNIEDSLGLVLEMSICFLLSLPSSFGRLNELLNNRIAWHSASTIEDSFSSMLIQVSRHLAFPLAFHVLTAVTEGSRSNK